jgi:hypothetical protein
MLLSKKGDCVRLNRKVVGLILLLACVSPARPAVVTGVQANVEAKMIGPSDIFKDFPALRWGMSIKEVGDAVKKAGANPLVSRSDKNQLTWDGKFGGMDGRATVICEKGSGVRQMGVIVHAFEKQRELFEQLSRKISERHGDAKEVSDTSVDTSKVWRLKDGFVIELRLIKDDDSPVIDIHWVKV